MSSESNLPPEGFSRLPRVLENFPVSRSHWLAGVKAGKYPAAVKLSTGVTAWKNRDLLALLESFDQKK
jgi:predicted DNA-binding transcriptional regulator AlpA